MHKNGNQNSAPPCECVDPLHLIRESGGYADMTLNTLIKSGSLCSESFTSPA